MRCLITGGGGQIGAALARHELARGSDVAVFVRPQSNLWRLDDVRERICVIHGDLADPEPATAAIEAFAPTHVVHAAWDGVTREHRNAPDHIVRNVSGSLALFGIVQRAGARVWVGLGSQAEYGPVNEVLTEQTATKPDTAYGAAKLAVGLLTRQMSAMAGMRFAWLRILATYGPADDERRLIPFVIRSLLRGESPELTAGTQSWDYLYVDDAVDAISRVMRSERAEGTFVLGAGSAESVREIATRLRDIVAPEIPLAFGRVAEAPGAPRMLRADIGALRQAIDWTPRTSLDDGLRQTVAWYRARHQER